jgi:hypothetical protein
MKKSTFMIALGSVFACAVLQTRPATAQLKTQSVDYRQADTALEGYLAYDGNVTGKRPGVLLVHRRDGMTDFTRKHADMIAKLGYVVFAADIFGKGVLPKDIPEMQVETAKYNKDRLLMRARAGRSRRAAAEFHGRFIQDRRHRLLLRRDGRLGAESYRRACRRDGCGPRLFPRLHTGGCEEHQGPRPHPARR